MKHLNLRVSLHWTIIALSLLMLTDAAAACTITVSNVESLYSNVSDASKAGCTIVLSGPQTYTLTRKDPSGNDRPNLGRIELQTDMSLVGVVGDRGAVVIDGSKTAVDGGPSYLIDPADTTTRTGVIRVGRGTNSIEWLTIKGNSTSAGGIETDLPRQSATVRIFQVVSTGSVRGIDVRNGFNEAKENLDVTIEGCELYANTSGNGQGIRIVNVADKGYISARLVNVSSHHNLVGLLIANNQTNHSRAIVSATNSNFSQNQQIGVTILGALRRTAEPADHNVINFDTDATTINDNSTNSSGDFGGLFIVASENTFAGEGPSHTSVNVGLLNASIAGNLPCDLAAYAARALAGAAGSHNSIVIGFSGTTPTLEPCGAASEGTNRIIVNSSITTE